MPYIIETRCPLPGDPYGDWTEADDAAEAKNTRRAVATLDEARSIVYGAIGENDDPPYFDGHFAADSLDEQGGTIGPLPDGTTIEVQALDWSALAERAYADGGWSMKPVKILNAFNAREGASGC